MTTPPNQSPVHNRQPHRTHQPLRPVWLCRNCAHPWPCGQARLDLINQFRNDRAALPTYMGVMLNLAIRDFTKLDPNAVTDPEDLNQRFVRWTHP